MGIFRKEFVATQNIKFLSREGRKKKGCWADTWECLTVSLPEAEKSNITPDFSRQRQNIFRPHELSRVRSQSAFGPGLSCPSTNVDNIPGVTGMKQSQVDRAQSIYRAF